MGEMTGRDPRPARSGLRMDGPIHPDDPETVEREWKAAKRTWTELNPSHTVRILMGRLCDRVAIALMRGTDGTPIGLSAGSLKDIKGEGRARSKNAEGPRRRPRRTEAKSQLLARMSAHEIRNTAEPGILGMNGKLAIEKPLRAEQTGE